MRMKCIYVCFSLVLACVNAVALGYTLTVDGTTDVIDGDTSGPAALAANPGPDGVISLLEAVDAFNNGPQATNRIYFNIPPSDSGYDPTEGIWVIRPQWPIAPIFATMTVDGATQTASQGDSNTDGPEIFLDGSLLASPAVGLTLQSMQTTIKGLGFRNFAGGPGASAIMCPRAVDSTITDSEFRDNAAGIRFRGFTSGNNTVSGNSFYGNGTALMLMDGTWENTITDNLIDGCTGDGIVIGGDSQGNTIGPGNIIRENGGAGIYVSDEDSGGNTITENSIYGNAYDGIFEEGTVIAVPIIIGVFSGNMVIGIAGPGGRVELFDAAAGEGKTFLGSATVNEDGFFLFTLETPDFTQLTGTFTDEWGTTGPFSDHWPPYIYVCNTGTDKEPGNSVTVINGATNEVVSTIEVGLMPKGIAVSAAASPFTLPTFHKCRRLIAVANNKSGTVSLISAASGRLLQTYPAGERPLGVYFSDRYLYVSNRRDDPVNAAGSLTIIDTAADRVVTTLGVGNGPGYGMLYDLLFNMFGVCNILSGDISLIREEQVPFLTGQFRTGGFPTDFRMATDRGSLLVTNFGDGRTDGLMKVEIPTGKHLGSVFTGFGPTCVDFGGPWAVVANSLSDNVSFVRMEDMTVESTIPVGPGPDRIVTSGANRAYVSNFFSSDGGNPGTLSVLDLARKKVIATVPVGRYPSGVALSDWYYSPLWPGGVWLPPERNGLHLVLIPRITDSGPDFGTAALFYIVDTEVSGAADMSLGVRLPGGKELWFAGDLRRLVKADSAGDIPRVARGFTYGGFRYGLLYFDVPEGAPTGYYCLMSKAFHPGTNKPIITVYSNYLALGFERPPL